MNMLSKKININYSTYFLALATTISVFNTTSASAFNINFDYTYDSNNFFDPTTTEGSNRRTTLEQAGRYYTDYINDSLSAIAVGTGIADIGGNGGSNTWTASFTNPGTGSNQTITDLEITADTITIYAGGHNMSSLGEGGSGGFSITNSSQEFIDLIKGRGQAGALTNPKTDIGTWGGSIAFDTDIVINVRDSEGNVTPTSFDWHNTTDSAGLDSTEFDFMSVAIHELAHVFGFTTSSTSSWMRQVDGTGFTGSNSVAVYQAENDPSATFVPLKPGSLAHWDNGVESITLGGDRQEVALDPNISNGTRKLLTNLDYAGLEDIGWEVETNVVPFEFSPGLGILLGGGFFGSLSLKKRWQAKSINKKNL